MAYSLDIFTGMLTPVGSGSGATTLATLSDVSLSAPVDLQVLQFNNASGKWKNVTLTTGGNVVGPSGVSSDSNVAIYNGTTGLILKDSKVNIDSNGAISVPAGQTYKIGAVGIAVDTIGVPTDSTSSNASTTYHGLLKKLDGTTTNFMRGDGAWAVPPGTTYATDKATTPQPLGTAGPGSAGTFSDVGHIHAMPALDTVNAPTDSTSSNATITAHGLLKKLDNVSTHYMDGTGNWSTPTASATDTNAQILAWMGL